MTYDKNGLGIAEMTFISVNYPEIWDTIYKLFDTDEEKAIEIAKKVIEYKDNKMAYKLFNVIQKLQDQALVLGDLKTAIKLNWLKYSIDSMDTNDVWLRLQEITIDGN